MKKISPFISSLLLATEKIALLAINFAISILIARYLGPEQFGQMSYLLALLVLFSPLAAVGLNSIITRELHANPQNEVLILGTALTIRIGGALLAFVLGMIVMPLIITDNQTALFFILLLCNLGNAFLVFDYWLQALVANQYAVLLRLVLTIFAVCTKGLALIVDAPMSVFIVLAGLDVLLLGILFVVLYGIKTGQLFKLEFKLAYAIELLKQSWWLMFSGIAAIIYLKIDQVMLGKMSSSEELGYYALAAKLSEVWYFIPLAVMSSYFPRILTKKAQGQAGYIVHLQKLNDVLFAFAVCIAIAFMFFADGFIRLFFGMVFLPASEILIIHIWIGVFVFMRALFSKWILVENLLKVSLLTQLAGAILNVCFNLWLIPLYGGKGAAYASIFAYISASYLILFLLKETRPMAFIITKSLLLPVRVIIRGNKLYS